MFSQGGEDGILQYLIRKVQVDRKLFVEFGVEGYQESNTRFLLLNDNWQGLVMDGSESNIARIKEDPLYWKHNISAVRAFVKRENINDLLEQNGASGDLGLLSIDIDGNDYWIWEAITVAHPRIVICEYNSLFGPTKKVTIPYDHDFQRSRSHFSHNYYGASIAALNSLAEKKGYLLVAGNSTGNNCFFVRSDIIGELIPCSPQEAYVQAQFRESRNADGTLSYLSFEESRKALSDLKVIDLDCLEQIPIRRIWE